MAKRLRRDAFVISRQRVFDGFLKIDGYRFRHSAIRREGDADGFIEPGFAHLVMERGDAAAVLVHDTERDVVFLAESFRIATLERGTSWTSETEATPGANDGKGWLREVAAGGIEPGEAPDAAARREVLEELGYRVGALEPIGVFYVSPGGTSERIHLFYAAVTSADLVNPDAYGEAGSDEDVLTAELPAEAFVAAARDGRIEDAKTLIAAQWLALRRMGARGG